jgi:hypothetical protein
MHFAAKTAMNLAPTQPYEFDASSNKTIFGLGRAMQTVGGTLILFGLLSGVGTFFILSGSVKSGNFLWSSIQTLVLLVFGWWTHRGGSRFVAVATTAGDDVKHLMAALGDLKKMYGSLATVIRLVFCLAAAFVVFMSLGALYSVFFR